VEEEMFETNCRLKEAENGLTNIEEENAFLRQQKQEFEDELNKQRVEYEELLIKYNDALLAPKVEARSPSNGSRSPPTSEREFKVSRVSEVSNNRQSLLLSEELPILSKLEEKLMNVSPEKAKVLSMRIDQLLNNDHLDNGAEQCDTGSKALRASSGSTSNAQVLLISIFPFLVVFLLFLFPLVKLSDYMPAFTNREAIKEPIVEETEIKEGETNS